MTRGQPGRAKPERPQHFVRYTTMALRHRLLKRLSEGTQLGMALEGLTAADLA
jgi:hypothetical protein